MTRIKPLPVRNKPMSKEEFMIQWVLLRASFRSEFSGVAAVQASSDAWKEIQKLK